jgi:hypothetical protein
MAAREEFVQRVKPEEADRMLGVLNEAAAVSGKPRHYESREETVSGQTLCAIYLIWDEG